MTDRHFEAANNRIRNIRIVLSVASRSYVRVRSWASLMLCLPHVKWRDRSWTDASSKKKVHHFRLCLAQLSSEGRQAQLNSVDVENYLPIYNEKHQRME